MLSQVQKKRLEKLKIKIFADGSSKKSIIFYNNKCNFIDGFTTNPSLMKENNVNDYKKFAKDILSKVKKPISFEVIGDNYNQIYKEAKIINSWGENVFVKIPIINSKGKYNLSLINRLNSLAVQGSIFLPPCIREELLSKILEASEINFSHCDSFIKLSTIRIGKGKFLYLTNLF